MTRWTFVRHGRSVANAEGWLSGWRDTPLTAEGRAGAEALGEKLQGVPFARAFASDLTRATQTAKALLDGRCPVQEVPALRERHMGAWEGLQREDLRKDGRLALLMTWSGRPPGGESHRDVALRMLAWLGTVPDGGPTLVVAHGAILRATLGRLDGLADHAIATWDLHNLEVAQRQVAQGTWLALHRALVG